MRGSIGGSSVNGGFIPQSVNSETDGETFEDGTDDFGEFDEWDYTEIFSTLYDPFSSVFDTLRRCCALFRVVETPSTY